MLKLLAAAAFVASVSVSCSEVSFIEIDAPADLQSKIDSIQHVKDSLAALQGDKVSIDITVPVVGNEDCSTGWDGATSQDFTIPVKKKLNLTFINHGSMANNWNNWNLRVKDASGTEVFLLRSDNYALVSNDPNAKPEIEIQTVPEGADFWAFFIEKMNGATVVMTIDHSMAGQAIVEVVATAEDGTIIKNTYTHAVSATEDISACLVCDGSWFDIKEAYLTASDVAEVFDEIATSITVKGTPAAIEVGSTDFWGNAEATVTFADGTTAPADTADITFVVPDLSTAGTKTILYSYSKTKLGAYGPSVAGYYTLDVLNPVTKLEVTTAPTYDTYYVYDTPVKFNATGLVVTATYADETFGVIDNSMLTYGQVPADGTQEVEISYVGTTSTVSVKCPVEVIKGTSAVGVSDCSGAFWGAHTPDHVIAAGESYTFKFFQYSTGANVWNGACTILRNIDWATNNVEYVVTRPDNWGWGTGWEGTVGTPGWPSIEALQAALNMAIIEVTVTNNGDDTAAIKYTFNCANGETYTQEYSNIAVVSSDLSVALTIDGCYLVFFD